VKTILVDTYSTYSILHSGRPKFLVDNQWNIRFHPPPPAIFRSLGTASPFLPSPLSVSNKQLLTFNIINILYYYSYTPPPPGQSLQTQFFPGFPCDPMKFKSSNKTPMKSNSSGSARPKTPRPIHDSSKFFPFSFCRDAQRLRGEALDIGQDAHTAGSVTVQVACRCQLISSLPACWACRPAGLQLDQEGSAIQLQSQPLVPVMAAACPASCSLLFQAFSPSRWAPSLTEPEIIKMPLVASA
jgi:hypothetical protein